MLANTSSNIIDNIKMLIEVHKPGRYTSSEFQTKVQAKQDESRRNSQNVQ